MTTRTGNPSAVPKKMKRLGNPARHNRVRGFLWPVREKAEIEAELRALQAQEAERRDRELTD